MSDEVQKAIWMNEEYLAHYQEIYDEAVKNGSENSKWWLDRINMHKQSIQALRQMQTEPATATNLHYQDEWWGVMYECGNCKKTLFGVSPFCPNCGRKLVSE